MSRWPVCISCATGFICSVPLSKPDNSLEGHCVSSIPNIELPYPPSLLQGSCTPLMVATLHPPSAGIAPQYSLPLGLGSGVGRPTLLEHTATVLVKQWWHAWRKTCKLPLSIQVPSSYCPTLFFSLVCIILSLCNTCYYITILYFMHHISVYPLFTCGLIINHSWPYNYLNKCSYSLPSPVSILDFINMFFHICDIRCKLTNTYYLSTPKHSPHHSLFHSLP